MPDKIQLQCPDEAEGITLNDGCPKGEHDWKITKKWVSVDFDDLIEDGIHSIQYQTYKAYSQSCKKCSAGSDVITNEKLPLVI